MNESKQPASLKTVPTLDDTKETTEHSIVSYTIPVRERRASFNDVYNVVNVFLPKYMTSQLDRHFMLSILLTAYDRFPIH